MPSIKSYIHQPYTPGASDSRRDDYDDMAVVASGARYRGDRGDVGEM